MFDLNDTVDVATAVVMAETAQMVAAVDSRRDFAVAYLDEGGHLRLFTFYGRPTGLYDELEERGVNLDTGSFARSWVDPDGVRRFLPEKGEMQNRLEQALKADEARPQG